MRLGCVLQAWAEKAAFAREWGGVQVPVRWPAGTRQWGLIERLTTLDEYLQVMEEEVWAETQFRIRIS